MNENFFCKSNRKLNFFIYFFTKIIHFLTLHIFDKDPHVGKLLHGGKIPLPNGGGLRTVDFDGRLDQSPNAKVQAKHEGNSIIS
jgi:hypothetical protein